jgi:hypothetical protein
MKMDNSGWRFQSLVLRLFECLLHLYPPHFRGEFSAEIRAVFLSRTREAEVHGGASWLAAAFQEITELVISIFRECWHELRVRKEKTMVPEDQLQKDAGAEGGWIPVLRPAGTPGALWFTGWTLLTTAAIPAALIAMAPLTVMFIWLINLGVKAGFWPAAQQSTLGLLGFLISFALVLALVQWYLLRRFLPKAWLWFIATGAGVLLGALAVGLSLGRSSVQSWHPIWIMAAVLLPVGLALGLAQWLYLRRFLPNAFWIIFIDVLAAGSILLAGGAFTSPVELMVLVLPGVITGLGLLLLLSQSHPNLHYQARREASREKSRRFPRLARVGIGVVALVPLFFACSWVYAASQLALAKNKGVYSTVEEAVIAKSQGFGGAEVVRIENVWAEPNSRTSQPHVWFGGATVYLDRVPEGHNRDHYSTGSLYIHVREGWVHVPEGAFPGFIGWVMELYNMEGVHR